MLFGVMKLWLLCSVAVVFVDRVKWLRELEYQGQMVYQDLWEDDRGGWRRLKGLEEVVTALRNEACLAWVEDTDLGACFNS